MKNRPIVTITTDFGDDFALSQLQAVLLSINPCIEIVVISNHVTPYCIAEGRFMIAQSQAFFPTGTIHIGVIDPGVGTDREGLIIQTQHHTFIGPNNGLFSASVNGRIKHLYQINEATVNKKPSITFHGRDIFARVAGLLTTKVKPLSIARPLSLNKFQTFDSLYNQIVHIDSYGNLKINNNCENFKIGEKLRLVLSKQTIEIPYVKTFAEVKTGCFLAYRGSHNILEIAQNLGNAAKLLNTRVGEVVNVEKVSIK